MSINYGCNDNELAVLRAFEEHGPELTLRELAKHCPSGRSDSTSWARNSLRKPRRHGFIKQAGRGRYAVTDKLALFNGAALAEARKGAHVSQEAVRKAIGASSRQRISDFERGAKRPQLTEVYQIAGFLKVRRFERALFHAAPPVIEQSAPNEDWSTVYGVSIYEPSEAPEAAA